MNIEKELRDTNKRIYNGIQKELYRWAGATVKFVATPKPQPDKGRLGQIIYFEGQAYGWGFMPFDSGDLSKSVRVHEILVNTLEWSILSDLHYAYYVEKGTPNSPAQAPFEKGIAEVFEQIIYPEIRGIVRMETQEMMTRVGRKIKTNLSFS